MTSTFQKYDVNAIISKLDAANDQFVGIYPGESSFRQPVHTVYGGANLFKYNTAEKFGKLSQKSLAQYAPNFIILAHALQMPGHETLPVTESEISRLIKSIDECGVDPSNKSLWLPYTVYRQVKQKLESEALEDFRIDFEDGFGNRPDEEEDSVAIKAAEELALGMQEGALPPFIGIRIKPFNREATERGVRTLDLFVTTLSEKTNGRLPENFVVTLPKVEIPEQVEACVDLFEVLESNTALKPGSLKMEIMIETTQSIINAKGEATIRTLVNSARGRCTGAHFGTYDYTASCDLIAAHQLMDSPVCDFARHVMKVALMGTGIFISDGATNVMPVGPHRAGVGESLNPVQIQENVETVHKAWKLDYDHIMHSLRHGFYQGWDLHPAQLPIRYAACYTFFLESYLESATRLRNFVEKAAQATLSGDVFDDAATGQGLLNYFLRALNCGAISATELELTSLSLSEIQSRSFLKILEGRAKL
tara:strand:+ start:2080 stop:3516 length:1437 start_codon:yes stop_codon:yes gene_type:complete